MHSLLDVFIETKHPLQRLTASIMQHIFIPKRFSYHSRIILTHLHTYRLLHQPHSDSLDYHSLDFKVCIGLNTATNYLDPYHHPNITTTTHTFNAVASAAFALMRRGLPHPCLDVLIVNSHFNIEEDQCGLLIYPHLLVVLEQD